MKATISLDAIDLLKIARLVHYTPHEKNESYYVRYENGGIEVVITLTEDSEFGYCVDMVGAHIVNDTSVDVELERGISTQIENVL